MRTRHEVINPVPREIILEELCKTNFIRTSNRGSFNIHTFNSKDSPLLMEEVGRLREITFRNIGGGTGEKFDIDEFDDKFEQIILWDSINEEIVGGYRIQLMKTLFESSEDKENFSPLATYFNLSPRFMKKYLPYSVELGRAFIQPMYQRSVFALESLFNGLGLWISKQNDGFVSWKNPATFLVGKITLYPKFGNLDPIYHFIDKYFLAKKPDLIKPKGKYGVVRPYEKLSPDVIFEDDFKKDFNMIVKRFNAPILIGQYGKLSPSMQCFGTIENSDFGDTEETAMMIKIPNIFVEYLKRYDIII